MVGGYLRKRSAHKRTRFQRAVATYTQSSRRIRSTHSSSSGYPTVSRTANRALVAIPTFDSSICFTIRLISKTRMATRHKFGLVKTSKSLSRPRCRSRKETKYARNCQIVSLPLRKSLKEAIGLTQLSKGRSPAVHGLRAMRGSVQLALRGSRTSTSQDDNSELIPLLIDPTATGSHDTAGPTVTERMAEPPPTYGQHNLDAIFSGVGYSGYQTPAVVSGTATPAHAGSVSRSLSGDNIAGLSQTTATPAFPQDLTERLRNVSFQPTSSHTQQLDSAESSPQPSRSGSASAAVPHGPVENHTQEASLSRTVPYNMQQLERLTSYNTATRTPARSPTEDGPPSYEAATSRPPSPGRSGD